MSGEQFLKILLLAFLSCALGWVVFSRQDTENQADRRCAVCEWYPLRHRFYIKER